MADEIAVPNEREWAMREYWETSEVARLFCGLHGNQVTLGPQHAARVNELVSLAERSIAASTVKYRASPREWVVWARNKGITIPGALEQAVADYAPLPAMPALERETKRKSAETKERDTMLRLIGGLAMAGFGVDLAKPHAAAVEIVRDLADKGIKISEGTVVKYLAEAAQTLDIKTQHEP